VRSETIRLAATSRRHRLLIGLAWGLAQLVILAGLVFAGAVAAGYLAVDVFSSHGVDSIVPAGLGAGAIGALAVNHSARGWLQRLRLRGLRVRGVAVEARAGALGYSYAASGRGPGTVRYIARVSWTDPGTGVSWRGERRYRFWGDDSKPLEAAFAIGAKVRVYYPAGRPSRFVIDVPFAPTMADLFLP
jgi:hypothetical protein